MTGAWTNTWKLGAKSLLLHPLRSSLTVLGIFIGVASVILLLAIGEGISRKAQEQIEGLGASNIIVRSIKPSNEATSGFRGAVPYGLTRMDFERLVETIPTIDRALPIRELRRQFRYSDKLVDGRLVGCTPEYAEVTHLKVDRGHFITDSELREKTNVCALSAEVSEKLFSYEDPIGQKIHIDEAYYVVVGVMKPRAPTSGIGGSFAAQDFSSDVYIPISTLWARIGDMVMTRRSGSFEGEILEISQITLRVGKVSQVMETADIIKESLARSHKGDDYGLTVPLELLEQAKTTRLMFILFMGLIAAISLLVGGIGIMNIMLATVTERTREIGIRRALGAKKRDITMQFLAETLLLSFVGGVIGVLVGVSGGWLTVAARWGVKRMFPDFFTKLPDLIKTVSPELVPWSIPVAFGIALVVGLVFGLYPARRAASMDPVEALRHE